MLNEVVRQNKLQDRVQLLGAVKADQVRNILIKGDIFLNSSLTEAFCIAIVEAVSCGLQVVTTNVGGIPEVLPPDLIWLGEPTVNGLVGALRRAISDRDEGNVVCPLEAHNRIREYYRWPDIAERTEMIYDSLVDSGDSNRKVNSKLRPHKAGSRLSGCAGDENDPNQLNRTNAALNSDWRSGHLNDKLNGLCKSVSPNGHLNGYLNGYLNGHLNGLSKSVSPNGLSGGQATNPVLRTNRVNNTAKKVLYENQPQLIDFDYLRENQDKTGPRQLLRQCYNSSWFFGTFLLLLLFVEYLMSLFYDLWSPRSQIDLCPSTAGLNASLSSVDQLTKIRNTKEVNSVLKVNRHQFTKSCTNCRLYVRSPAALVSLTSCREERLEERLKDGYLANTSSDLASWIRSRQYSLCNQLNNHSSSNHSFNLANYMHSLDRTESTNPVNLVANAELRTTAAVAPNRRGLRTTMLMNHKTDAEPHCSTAGDRELRLGSVADDLERLESERSDCWSERVDSERVDSERVHRKASQTSDRRRNQTECAIYQCQHTIEAPSECNYETNATDDEAMSQESIESLEFGKQTVFDEDEKHSTTESTSGYNTSNSLDSDNGSDSSSDSNSTGSANLDDLADLSSNYDCDPANDQQLRYDTASVPSLGDRRLSTDPEANRANHPMHPKRRKKSIVLSSTIDKELNVELNNQLLNDQLASLLVLNEKQSEAKELFCESDLNLNNNGPNAFECCTYRCDDRLRLRRRRSILVKN